MITAPAPILVILKKQIRESNEIVKTQQPKTQLIIPCVWIITCDTRRPSRDFVAESISPSPYLGLSFTTCAEPFSSDTIEQSIRLQRMTHKVQIFWLQFALHPDLWCVAWTEDFENQDERKTWQVKILLKNWQVVHERRLTVLPNAYRENCRANQQAK